ncbi:MAG: ATP synthase F1 subunit gamma [Butyrivibrio sp.]|nr:ATP synthase F1 subunit gamma [Butyrivibrio sp.]
MASMKDIKRRKESIQSTGQITKAMKLVSTVKLQKARSKAESARPYFDAMYNTVFGMLARSGDIEHRYLKAGETDKKAVIVVTANRGLAGGYNSNITKLVTSSGIRPEDAMIYAVGTKGRDFLNRRGYEIAADFSEVINEPMFSDALEIGRTVLEAFEQGKVGEIYLAYTSFKNTVVHEPKMVKLLPVSPEDIKEEAKEPQDQLTLVSYEPEEEEALDIIIPKYINSLIYGALMEAVASENGARMTAMDNATSNAEEIISDLSLMYNRARQGSITQELTEIIAGANAIS